MTLYIGGQVGFKPRVIEGIPEKAKFESPLSVLLDGQQWITSIYQVTLRKQIVKTSTPKNKKLNTNLYQYKKALNSNLDREEAIINIAEDKNLTRTRRLTLIWFFVH